ncbi:hypothetical protein JCM30471_07500 [Desulfuromonas carbonis]|uniref:sensor histidine kinase n=1 Tax=Desulfuromonas sp. DDH964 TaxID=1823759 RepID=UPI00078D7AAA|nr:HAMP domain-containing sensor histidine kinase [Desulfuromonas sp. DDH964]AMV72266.1 nitrogen fixation master sensor histidine kinase, PAS domain-containing [Desulfuromonas sp. DDH964]
MRPLPWGRPPRPNDRLFPSPAKTGQESGLAPGTLDDILQVIDIGILTLDLGARQTGYRNAASFEILGDTEAPLGYPALHRLLIEPLRGEDGSIPLQGTAAQRHGDRILSLSLFRISPEGCCLFIRNITEKARLESIAQAVNTMDNIGFIFSGIRHEIGNPLNSIKVTMTVLRNNLENFSPAQIETYIDRTLGEIGRIEFLLRSLRNFSMFESVDCTIVDLNELLGDFIPLIERDLDKKGIELRCHLAPTPLLVRIDQRALHQVLLNLVTNAVDALAGEKENPHLVLTTYQRENLAQLIVRDNGCGMTEAQAKHLFQPFNTTKANGNGLGLVITRKLLALMTGSVEIHSREGVGTTVTVSLPLLATTAVPEQEREPEQGGAE